MIGTKLKLNNQSEMVYQPWDCTTTGHSKVAEWSSKPQTALKVLQYSKGSFFKTYPLIFNSANADPTKTWMMGCQIAAINVQKTDDDYTLLNQVFFSLQNKSGYILKPKYLREGVFLESKIRQTITINFISGIMLHTLSDDHIKEINISTYVVGPIEDEKANSTHVFKSIKEKFINPIFSNEKITLTIYNPDISFIYIKIKNSDNLIGRGVIPIRALNQGFRLLSLYNNECVIKDQALISCLVTINNMN